MMKVKREKAFLPGTTAERGKIFRNPVLAGTYPDPSVCRVGEDYFLVTSSFAYYPGVPLFHSKDLVNWEQIGHVLDRPSQLNLDGVEQSEGIFAPTIRYHQGVFYVSTTNVGRGGNFIVTTTDPFGAWSDPYWLPEAPGIDPSLFFDDDGKAYYIGTRPNPDGVRYDGDWEIWLQELDLEKMRLVGPVYTLWKGAMAGVIWPEGPHLYKIDGCYYLLISEGGTGHHHALTIARSEGGVTGPYYGNPANPILTHRHLGRDYPIVNVGHGDLVQTQKGEWWIVVLASRPSGGYYRNLGRETFLVPVVWEDGWPVVSPGDGRVKFEYMRPDLPAGEKKPRLACTHFTEEVLGPEWQFLRTPRDNFWSLTARPGYLRLKLKAESVKELVNPSFIGRRLQHHNFSAGAAMEFSPRQEREEAGLVLLQNHDYHWRFVVTQKSGERLVQLIQCAGGVEEVIGEKVCSTQRLILLLQARGQEYDFYYGESEGTWFTLAKRVDGRILSTDVAGGFVGVFIGLYASSNGGAEDNYADFDWFEYTAL